VAVAGGGECSRRTAALARAVGRAVAANGAVLVCGGLGGVMDAAARGAAEAGGTVVGLLPGYERAAGSRHLTVTIPTGLGHARNTLVAAAGDALIALPGEHGTLAEIALARALGRPVVVLGSWRELRGVGRASTAEDAVRRALALAAAQRPGVRGRGAGRGGAGLR
jgi:uncharacterized protein (TIGR00725 family)